MSWLEYVTNRQSFESLYSAPPSLMGVVVTNVGKLGLVDFYLDQLPDIKPKRGIWASCKDTIKVNVSMSFLITPEILDIPRNLFFPDLFDININPNPEYSERIIYEDNYSYLETTDRIIVTITNKASQFSFFAYQATVMRLSPVSLSETLPKQNA